MASTGSGSGDFSGPDLKGTTSHAIRLFSTNLGATLSIMAKWAEALHGGDGLRATVADIAVLVGADSAKIARLCWNRPSHRRIASVHSGDPKKDRSSPIFALDVFGAAMRGAQDGSIWSMTELRDQDPTLIPMNCGRHPGEHGVAEVLVVCLETRDQGADIIELDYWSKPAEQVRTSLAVLGPELSSSWRRRLPGTAQKHIVKLANSRGRSEPHLSEVSILHPENPMGLSRSEFRICMMLREGMKAKAIAEALSVATPTVRSHLSNIFQKTQTSGQIELIQTMFRDDFDGPAAGWLRP